MKTLSVKLPTNLEIIQRHQEHGTWPPESIAVELKHSTRWFILVPNLSTWDAMIIEPHGHWKKVLKRGLSTKEANSLLNKVIHDTTVFKDNDRRTHVCLLQSFIS